MKNLMTFVIQQKILLAILGVGVTIFGFEVWKYKDEQYQKLLASQQVLCEKSNVNALDIIRNSKVLSSAYNPEFVGKNITPRNEIQQPGINSPMKKDGNYETYILIRTNKRPLIPNNTPHYKSVYFESYSKPPGDDLNHAAIVLAKPINAQSALVDSHCSPKPFVTPLTDLYEVVQPSDFFPPN